MEEEIHILRNQLLKKYQLKNRVYVSKNSNLGRDFHINLENFYNEAIDGFKLIEQNKRKDYKDDLKSNYHSRAFKQFFNDLNLEGVKLTKAIEFLYKGNRTIRSFLKDSKTIKGGSKDFFAVAKGYKGWNDFIHFLRSGESKNSNKKIPKTILINRDTKEKNEVLSFSITETYYRDNNVNWTDIIKNVKRNIFDYKNVFEIKELSYQLKYEHFSFSDLVENINVIENQIIEEVFIYSLNYLKDFGVDIVGNLFKYKDEKYRFTIDFEKRSRKLNICFLSINGKIKNTESEININQLGLVKSIHFLYPKFLDLLLVNYIEEVSSIFMYSYLYLERQLISSYKELRKLLFEDLYNILNIEIELRNKQGLISNGFFVFTFRNNSRFRYFFDSEYLPKLILQFKQNQTTEFSPFELVMNLLTEEAVHTINLLMDIEINELRFLDSVEFKSAEDDYCFWVAESHLIDHKEISTYTIQTTESFIFQLSFKREYETEFVEILESCRKSLETQFAKNLEDCYTYINTIVHIRDMKSAQKQSENISAFINTTINYNQV